ncbi:alkene reductase [Caulobacter sp. RHG1]|uniref:alkene reductase n=1 Tax=Caulobacter sp. (strain RHG1) TaxID=2545762 RepID=UPI001554F03E|nr:alkene reductase [Caulobacter sp. RHG1]NQE65365.1 hypothetical protein [Caulobacter sp. RHG1]
MTTLFDSFDLAGRRLRNRIAMAPLTRARSPENIATERNALYYAQRATAGLIISEGTPISREGQGYLFNPSIYTLEQIEGWRLTTNTVHALGGTIFAQLWHVGRVSHISIQEGGKSPVGPSDKIAQNAWSYAYRDDGSPGRIPASPPRALTTEEVGRVVQDFAQAAANAIEAGFDGVEIHGANGYLLEQFMNPKVNDREDEYTGATLKGRLRFPLEVVDAVIARIGREKTAIRISPYAQDFGMPLYNGVEETYAALVEALGSRSIAYVHVMDHTEAGAKAPEPSPVAARIEPMLRQFRGQLPNTGLMVAGAMSRKRADRLLAEGVVDMIVFGRWFISNPDLVARLQNDWPLADADPASFYPNPETLKNRDVEGYIDYPPHSIA